MLRGRLLLDQHFEDLRYVSDFQQLHSHDRNVIRGSLVLDYYFAANLREIDFQLLRR